jgi:hypothetical protein
MLPDPLPVHLFLTGKSLPPNRFRLLIDTHAKPTDCGGRAIAPTMSSHAIVNAGGSNGIAAALLSQECDQTDAPSMPPESTFCRFALHK